MPLEIASLSGRERPFMFVALNWACWALVQKGSNILVVRMLVFGTDKGNTVNGGEVGL